MIQSSRRMILVTFVFSLSVWGPAAAGAQPNFPEGNASSAAAAGTATEKADIPAVPEKVDINPLARDEEIGARLKSVLDATGWFDEPKVRVQQGVVFLSGRAKSEELRAWAGNLARNTQDVVAVANRIEVTKPSVWDFRAAWSSLATLCRDFVRAIPLFIFGLLILALFFGAGVFAARGVERLFRRRIRARLLLAVLARSVGAFVFLLGAYIILRVFGLSQLALSIVGGTGLIGLALGIAFRDITENFLASIFLSMQRPFETGDLIEVAGVTGYVQQLNIRTTIVMTLEGNIVQIPNSAVYKSTVRNFTTNSNRREDFVVGIGYDDAIDQAQEIARQVLADHPAVLDEPEPSVLADSMGKATINLRVYFWINGREHSWLKVRSSVIRLVKLAFQKNGISMPDEAREVVFPQGVEVTMLEAKRAASHDAKFKKQRGSRAKYEHDEVVSTKAEGDLGSEAGVIKEQARGSRPLTEQENLIKLPAAGPPES